MSTQKQIDANRRNAQKSTGPRTPEGLAAVRLNGVRHGLCAETLVLEGESESDFHTLLDSLCAEHVPATPTEELLVSQLAMAAWRLRRLYNMEGGFFCVRALNLEQMIDEDYTNLSTADRQAIVFLTDSKGPDTLSKFGRYEARLERSIYRAIHELQRLKARRPAPKPIEAETSQTKTANQTQSEPKIPVSPADQPETPKSQPIPACDAITIANDIS
jgi:hypothetical protein